MTTAPRVRDLAETDVVRTAGLHELVLPMEFISRFGTRFLRRYHLAWMESPSSLCLVAEDDKGLVIGVLLGSVDPAEHIAGMVRAHGWALGVEMALAALVRPRQAGELVRSRLRRYVRGLWRVRARRGGSPTVAHESSSDRAPSAGTEPSPPGAAGEITHLFVDPSSSGRGVGRALLEEAARRGRKADLSELVLVTPPDLPARQFYERLGWRNDGAVTSRSGEAFVRYRWPLIDGRAG